MKLDDLVKMNIPKYSPIEIEAEVEFSSDIRTTVGYFNCIDEKPSPRVRYYQFGYHSFDGVHQKFERESYESIRHIRKISVLIPKEKQ